MITSEQMKLFRVEGSEETGDLTITHKRSGWYALAIQKGAGSGPQSLQALLNISGKTLPVVAWEVWEPLNGDPVERFIGRNPGKALECILSNVEVAK